MPSSAHYSDRDTSLESSGLNPFNFNSILCVNDTQQLIQVTFAKSSLQEMEEEKDLSLASPTANITKPTTSLSDTFTAQNILRDIQTQLMVVDFEPLEPLLEQVKSTTQDMQQTCADVETFINDFETLDIDKFILKPKKRKESLGHITIDSSSSNTFNETNEDIKLLSMDLMKSLSENIADICSRKKILKRSNGYKLTTLAKELLQISCDGAHDALFDATLLEQLCVAHFDANDLECKNISFTDTLLNMQSNEKVKKLLPAYKPMKHILSTNLQTRSIKNGITYENLIDTFKAKGIDEMRLLLEGRVNGKATIIKKKQILDNIINYIMSLR